MFPKIISPISTNRQFLTVFCITLAIFAIFVLVAGIVIFFMFLSIPCAFSSCHSNAYCVNRRFIAECKCKLGYNGDGIEFCDECGLASAENNLRVVGGIPAVPHSWPSAVMFYASYRTLVDLDGDRVLVTESFFCGGSLIDRRTVLTAGHCILDDFEYFYNNKTYIINVTLNEFNPTVETIYRVYVGAHRFIEPDYDIKPARVITAKKAFRSEHYDPNNFLNDIGILKLSHAVELNENVQVACLPDPKVKVFPKATNIDAYALGWGRLNEYGYLPYELQNVLITIYNGSLCENVTEGMNPNWDSQICAGEYEGGKDTCQGDSGSPLFVIDQVGSKFKYIQAGIVSYGQGCARQYLPGIYTRTSYFSNWIHQHAG